jgi:DNA-binding NarL/FixJ family response regulator
MSAIRVAVLSATQLFAESLARLVDREPLFVRVGGAGDANVDVLLVDSNLEDLFDICVRHASAGRARIVALGVPEEGAKAEDLLIAGARGLLFRHARECDLLQAVPHVHAGKIWAPRHVVAAAWEKSWSDAVPVERLAGWTRLSAREREVLRYAASGFANKELADRLAISEATVKVHLTHIFQKVGCRTRSELAAVYHGLATIHADRPTR